MAVSAPDWGEGGSGRNSDEQYTSARPYPGPWWSQDAVASAALDPPVRASHSEPRLARERGNYNASSISNGQQSLLWGGLDPSALRLRMLQNRSVTQRSMGHGVCTSFKGLVPRTAYPCVHLHNLISAFGDGVSEQSVPTRDVPRSSNIYLSSLPPSASSSFLSCFISSRCFIISRCASKPNKSQTSLSYQPVFFNIPHKPQNVRFRPRCFQGHQVRA